MPRCFFTALAATLLLFLSYPSTFPAMATGSIISYGDTGDAAQAETASDATTETQQDSAQQARLPSILEILEADGRFSLFRTMIDMAGLSDIFINDGPMTVLVPADDALMSKFDIFMGDAKGDAYDKRLRKLVLAHVLHGGFSLQDMKDNIGFAGGRENLETASKDAITLMMRGDLVHVYDERAQVTALIPLGESRDGFIHKLEGGVVLPR